MLTSLCRPFDKNRLSVTCYQTSAQDSSQAQLLCRWIDRSDNPQYSSFGIHQLTIQRRGSALQFRRWSSTRQQPALWMALFFKTFESIYLPLCHSQLCPLWQLADMLEMVLFHCTFVALKDRSLLTTALHPDEYQISGENKLFSG
jgi:hypothetical protein